MGNLTFFVCTPVVNSGITVLNFPVKTARERFGRLVQMRANKREDQKKFARGDIAAAISA